QSNRATAGPGRIPRVIEIEARGGAPTARSGRACPPPDASKQEHKPAQSSADALFECFPADHRHALDLDQHAGPGEVRNRDQRARRGVAVREEPLAQLYEAVAVARIVDEDGHGHEIGEAAAGAAQVLVDKPENHTLLLPSL